MSDFTTKHKILASYADRGAINYVVRWNVKVSGTIAFLNQHLERRREESHNCTYENAILCRSCVQKDHISQESIE